jgi:hypothetical protein
MVEIQIEEFLDADMNLLIEGPAKDYANMDLPQKDAEEAWAEINKRVNG